MELSYESLLAGNIEAAELFGPFGTAARNHPEVRLLYDTAFEWRELTGTWPMHHALAAYTDLLDRDPEAPRRLVDAFRRSSLYAGANLDHLADEYTRRYGGDVRALKERVKPARIEQLYPWSLTAEDRRCIEAVLAMSLEFGFIERNYSVDDIVFQY